MMNSLMWFQSVTEQAISLGQYHLLSKGREEREGQLLGRGHGVCDSKKRSGLRVRGPGIQF